MTKWFVTIEVRPLRPTDDAFVALDHGALAHLAGVPEDIGASPVGGVDHYRIVATREAAEGHQAFDYVRAQFRETRREHRACPNGRWRRRTTSPIWRRWSAWRWPVIHRPRGCNRYLKPAFTRGPSRSWHGQDARASAVPASPRPRH